MPAMKDPDGTVHEIVPAGVDALSRLGWELVDEPKPKRLADDQPPRPKAARKG